MEHKSVIEAAVDTAVFTAKFAFGVVAIVGFVWLITW